MASKTKKMSNEGQETKVPMGRSIGWVFVIGIVVGGIVVFLAVAGRTEGIIQQRRALLQEKKAKASGEVVPAPEAAPSESATTSPSTDELTR